MEYAYDIRKGDIYQVLNTDGNLSVCLLLYSEKGADIPGRRLWKAAPHLGTIKIDDEALFIYKLSGKMPDYILDKRTHYEKR